MTRMLPFFAQTCAILLGVVPHRPELIDPEVPAVAADANLPVDDGAGAGQANQERTSQHQGGTDEQSDRGKHDVDGAFDQAGMEAAHVEPIAQNAPLINRVDRQFAEQALVVTL